jgi:IS30 family transposase
VRKQHLDLLAESSRYSTFPRLCNLARHAELRWRVAQKLALQWSPKQIAGWLQRSVIPSI